jgi:hypothetical protein
MSPPQCKTGAVEGAVKHSSDKVVEMKAYLEVEIQESISSLPIKEIGYFLHEIRCCRIRVPATHNDMTDWQIVDIDPGEDDDHKHLDLATWLRRENWIYWYASGKGSAPQHIHDPRSSSRLCSVGSFQ